MTITKTQASPVDSRPPTYARELGLLGAVPAFSCFYDPRFVYYLYVPKQYFELKSARLIVLIHGSGRNSFQLRECYQSFAEEHNVFLICPLFPVGFIDPDDTDNYKNIDYKGVRYDVIVLRMIEEACTRYPRLDAGKFCLYGFSGGGQFVHRFAYLHPKRVRALVCGAPGACTEWDSSRDFPEGVQNLETAFSDQADVDWNMLRTVPALFMCGSLDTDDSFCKVRNRPPLGPQGRLGSSKLLAKSWMQHGSFVQFQRIEGARHEERKFVEAVSAYLGKFT